MSDISSISLLLATMDLKMVQSVLGAMHAADAGAAAAAGHGTGSRHGPAATVEPTRRFEPRSVYHPTPRYEPRRVIHPTTRAEAPCLPAPAACPCPEVPTPLSCPGVTPVWKTLPDPIKHAPSATMIKTTIVRVDIRNKGTLIDTFI